MIIWFILVFLFGAGIGLIIGLMCTKKIDTFTYEALQKEEAETASRIMELQEMRDKLQQEIIDRDQVLKDLKENGVQVIEHELSIYRNSMQSLKERLRNECELEYHIILEDLAETFTQESECRRIAIKELEDTLATLKATIDSAVEANKREVAKEQEQNFYRLNIPEKDLEEIKQLRLVADLLRDKEPLNKVIWKVYYEKPTSDLVGRVIGPGVHTGIYKITNLQNQMCYVGQAANLADRWKQHIKRGLGAETPTKNKLYPIMQSVGVENFSFEVIEECDRSKLNEREDYWQEYFHAIDFGYSIK